MTHSQKLLLFKYFGPVKLTRRDINMYTIATNINWHIYGKEVVEASSPLSNRCREVKLKVYSAPCQPHQDVHRSRTHKNQQSLTKQMSAPLGLLKARSRAINIAKATTDSPPARAKALKQLISDFERRCLGKPSLPWELGTPAPGLTLRQHAGNGR